MPTDAEIDDVCAAVKAWRHWVGNDMLDRLGVPNTADVRGRDARFRSRLGEADKRAFAKMLMYFEIGPYKDDLHLWNEPGLKLFVSHVALAKERLVPLAGSLRRYGVLSFLAHEDIAPMRKWHEALLEALGSMDALLSFHSEGFNASEWCGQEVGFALARRVPVVPVMAGEPPCGFLGVLQALKFKVGDENAVAEAVFKSLVGRQDTRELMGNALARQLKFAGSYHRAGFLIDHLKQCVPLDKEALRNIDLASLLNDQVPDDLDPYEW